MKNYFLFDFKKAVNELVWRRMRTMTAKPDAYAAPMAGTESKGLWCYQLCLCRKVSLTTSKRNTSAQLHAVMVKGRIGTISNKVSHQGAAIACISSLLYSPDSLIAAKVVNPAFINFFTS